LVESLQESAIARCIADGGTRCSYCRSGGRSCAAAKYLKGQGFENVYNVGGCSTLKP